MRVCARVCSLCGRGDGGYLHIRWELRLCILDKVVKVVCCWIDEALQVEALLAHPLAGGVRDAAVTKLHTSTRQGRLKNRS